MCPALIFAARRTVRVIGRTKILIVSINTRAGFSHMGAPPGRRFADTFFGALDTPDIIRASHIGRPRVTVNRRWEEEDRR